MNSVTDIVKRVNQPRGGLLPIKTFEVVDSEADPIICEGIPPIIVGKVIDSMLHITIHTPKDKLFKTSIIGYTGRLEYFARQFSYGAAEVEGVMTEIEDEDGEVNVHKLIQRIDGYHERTDFYHLALCLSLIHQYDIWADDFGYISRRSSIESSRPKFYTKGDIRKLVKLYVRTLNWLCATITNKQIVFDFKFYPDGYTDKIKYGVGDFVCNDTLFDLKCTRYAPDSKATLQILIYYIMGLHSNNKLYKYIKYIGLYSPITDKLWRLNVNKITPELIQYISNEVIGYE